MKTNHGEGREAAWQLLDDQNQVSVRERLKARMASQHRATFQAFPATRL